MKKLQSAIAPGATYFAEHVGCQNTRPDIAQVLRWLEASGLRRTEAITLAQLCVLHTCAFDGIHADRSVQRIAEFQTAMSADAVLLVVGCLGDIERERLARIAATDARVVRLSPRELSRLSEHFAAPDSPVAFAPVATEEDRVRIRISRGCANRCSFCAIPSAQGATRSLPINTILKILEPYYREGRREFVLASEDAGAFGRDLGSRLPDLLKAIADRFVECRFTLSTVNPHWAYRYLADIVELIQSGHLVPHLYCPAQSGSTAILKRMRRGYTAEIVHDVYTRLLAVKPSSRLFQDILVGFPGETQDDFEASKDLVRRFPPYELRVFCWSARTGTAAASMSGQLAPVVRAERTRELAAGFLQDWFARSGHAQPQNRIRMIFGRAALPVGSNIPLFGPPDTDSLAVVQTLESRQPVSAARSQMTFPSLPIIG